MAPNNTADPADALATGLNDGADGFTPGPWEAGTVFRDSVSVYDPHGGLIAEVGSSINPRSPDQTRTDARLIAAAPEMHAALRLCAAQFRHYADLHAAKGTGDGDVKAMTNLRYAELCEAALAKAQARQDG